MGKTAAKKTIAAIASLKNPDVRRMACAIFLAKGDIAAKMFFLVFAGGVCGFLFPALLTRNATGWIACTAAGAAVGLAAGVLPLLAAVRPAANLVHVRRYPHTITIVPARWLGDQCLMEMIQITGNIPANGKTVTCTETIPAKARSAFEDLPGGPPAGGASTTPLPEPPAVAEATARTIPCPCCGESVDIDEMFCRECGQRVREDGEPQAPVKRTQKPGEVSRGRYDAWGH